MEINNITFENFRPFYGRVDIDLTINNNENIILIGGKNGHGKTNFLLGVVWCLYGELIGKVDDSFKAEVANNSAQFLDSILNRDKKAEGGKDFSVEVVFSNVSYGDNTQKSTIKIKRSYDVITQNELLNIDSDDELLIVGSTKEEKQNFINDYLVPIEIARFVFFDAEKISQIADLTTARQAKLMNQILGNMLGLNIYQNLLDEIESYIRVLKKESSTDEIKTQIISFENNIKAAKQQIETKIFTLQAKNKKVTEVNIKIEQLEIQISHKGGDNTNISNLHQQKNALEEQRDKLQKKFANMVDIIPLFMLSGLMQETKEHIEIEQSNIDNALSKEGFSEKMDLLIEELFNKGEMPNPDIKLEQKIFYRDKSKELVGLISDNENDIHLLAFKHNLDLSKIKDLENKYSDIQTRSDTNFIDIITDFSKKKNELNTLERKIRQLELNSADDLTKSLIEDKNNLQNNRDELNKDIGRIESDIAKLENDNSTHEKRLSNLYATSKVNEKNQKKIELSSKYITVLKDFIKEEKEEKTDAIRKKLLAELQNLWHKRLINSVDLTMLPNDKGMDVELFDKNTNPIKSKELSKGEQQIYVSALLKAILDSSIHNLPVFIDTPLARLDSEHRDNILRHYYPNLSTQVVVFSTDTEITATKYKEIKQYVANSYLIKNIGDKSSIYEGYFN